MAILSLVFNCLHIPLAQHKCMGPTVCLEYLGIILDSMNMEARLPLDKVQRILEFIDTLPVKSFCTERELLQLLGHFNCASRVILSGRSFVSYLLSIACSVKDLHQTEKLDCQCYEDLYMWRKFLKSGMGFHFFMRQTLSPILI